MPNCWVDINVDGQTMEGYLTQPEAGGRYADAWSKTLAWFDQYLKG